MRFLFLLPVAVGLAFAGGLFAFRASQLKGQDLGIDFNYPRHLVTREMEIETAAMKSRQPGGLETEDEIGRPISIAPEHGSIPEFVLFIKDGCPCSIDAQPLFNRLARKFQGKVDFIGVIDGDRAHARTYAERYTCAFPIVGDANQRIVHRFQAVAGLYSALIARNGHIVKMWPGYSAKILEEMNHLLSEEAAIKTTPFDPQYAPTVKAAGCAFTGDWAR